MTEDTYHLGIKALIRDAKGHILLLRVNPAMVDGEDYWDLPGGRVQRGESIADTLYREVMEETGIALAANKPIGMVLSTIRIPVGTSDVGLILSIYECRIPQDAHISISDEHLAAEWFDTQKAAELLAVKYPADFCEFIAELA